MMVHMTALLLNKIEYNKKAIEWHFFFLQTRVDQKSSS